MMQRPERREVSARTIEDMEKVRAIVDTFAPEERRQSLADTYGPMVPVPNRNTVLYEAYQNEIMLGLAEIIEGMATAQAAANAPKKRGRPPKTAEATSQDAGMDRPGEEAVATD